MGVECMSTKIIKAWINGAIQEIEVEDIVSPEQPLSIEDRLLAIEQTHSPEIVRTVTLLADAWEGTDCRYSQVVTIDGVTKYSKIDLQPDAEQLSIFYEKDVAFLAENEDGIVTIVCIGQKPVNDYVIQATMTEVIVNE
jgi:hypothetical protein